MGTAKARPSPAKPSQAESQAQPSRKPSQAKPSQVKPSQAGARQGKARQGKTQRNERQKARQAEGYARARQGKARQDKERVSPPSRTCCFVKQAPDQAQRLSKVCSRKEAVTQQQCQRVLVHLCFAFQTEGTRTKGEAGEESHAPTICITSKG